MVTRFQRGWSLDWRGNSLDFEGWSGRCHTHDHDMRRWLMLYITYSGSALDRSEVVLLHISEQKAFVV